MALKTLVTGCDKSETSIAAGRMQLTATCRNPSPVKSKRRDWSVYEYGDMNGVIASTFPSYEAISGLYAIRANPRAAVSPRIQTLADEITGSESNKKEQARLLYEWRAKKITYAGNCVGLGAVVPRDMDWVLDTKMGDCKDGATLLQALLAAKGIRSVQALVNVGSSYELSPIPTIQAVNHVITYIPEWDMFLDSTSTSTPFGLVPNGLYGKPALLTDGSGTKTIPTLPPSATSVVARAKIRLFPDRSATGDVSVAMKGMFAISARESSRWMTQENREDFMRSTYNSDDNGGWGKLEEDDPKPLLDTFNYKVSFLNKDYFEPAPSGLGLWLPAPVMGLPTSLAMSGGSELHTTKFACTGGSSSEELIFELPPKLNIISVPKCVTFKEGSLSYRSTYERKGFVIKVTRSFVDGNPKAICGIEEQARYRKLANAVQAEARSQLLYK